MRVLVTDGNTRAALAVTRSLGRRGHSVFVGDQRPRALAKASRYCAKGVTYADPAVREDAFVEDLLTVVRRDSIDVLLPVTDVSTAVVSDRRELFDGLCRIPLASREAIECATDKVRLLKVASQLQVPVPRTVFLDSRGALDTTLEEVRFPVVVKPRRSRFPTAEGWQAYAVSYAADAQALHRVVAAVPDAGFPLILQERVEGPGMGVFLCLRAGRVVAQFSHRRVRERPPSGGVSVLCESTAMPSVALDYATRLLAQLNWQGVAMVEFKQDRRDGIPKLMEINTRFWGSLQLAIDAGMDFPVLLVEDGEASHDYQIGVRSRWFWGDVDALLLRLFDSTILLPADAPGRFSTIVEFLKLFQANVHYDNPTRGDFRPWLHESGEWLRRMISR